MKISVLGNIIDTKDIYMITPIVGDKYFIASKLRTASEPLREKHKDLNHSGFEFEIKFFNQETLKIDLNGSDMWSKWNWWETDYLDKIKMVEHQIINIRNIIIAYWNKEKSEIPLIEFMFNKE